MDLDATGVAVAAPLTYQPIAFAALNQCDGTLVAGLQPTCELAHGSPLTPRKAAQMQQQEVLSRRNPRILGRGLTELQEFRQSTPELREGLVLAFAYQILAP
jgi:hypothetical protein